MVHPVFGSSLNFCFFWREGEAFSLAFNIDIEERDWIWNPAEGVFFSFRSQNKYLYGTLSFPFFSLLFLFYLAKKNVVVSFRYRVLVTKNRKMPLGRCDSLELSRAAPDFVSVDWTHTFKFSIIPNDFFLVKNDNHGI
jgi:hypothetical protein